MFAERDDGGAVQPGSDFAHGGLGAGGIAMPECGPPAGTVHGPELFEGLFQQVGRFSGDGRDVAVRGDALRPVAAVALGGRCARVIRRCLARHGQGRDDGN